MELQYTEGYKAFKKKVDNLIQTPSDIVKELVENSLDAGASKITILLDGDILGRITIKDNGSGVPTETLCALCKNGPYGPVKYVNAQFLDEDLLPKQEEMDFRDIDEQEKRVIEQIDTTKEEKQLKNNQKTSETSLKGNDIDDLGGINATQKQTKFGFRGLSLMSIIAKCSIEIDTKTQGKKGVVFKYFDGLGNLEHTENNTQGTTVTVSNLFRYFRDDKTRIKDNLQLFTSKFNKCIVDLMLSNTQTEFDFYIGEKLIFSCKGDFRQRVKEIFTKKTFENFLFIEWRKRSISVNGVICKAEIDNQEAVPGYVATYINGRIVENNLIKSAVRDAMKMYGLFDKFYVLSITMPDIDVDFSAINKKIVTFSSDEWVYQTIYECVKINLKHNDDCKVREIDQPKAIEKHNQQTFQFFDKQIDFFQAIDGAIMHEREISESAPQDEMREQLGGLTFPQLVKQSQKLKSSTNIDFPTYSIANIHGVLFDRFVLISRGDFFYAIDYIRARKRFYYDLYVEQAKNDRLQRVLLPEPLLVLPYMASHISSPHFLREFRRYGFVFKPYLQDYLQLTEIPNMFVGVINISDFFTQLFDELLMMNFSADKLQSTMLGKIACDNLTMSAEGMTTGEIREFLKTLEKKKFLNTPDGLPITLVFSKTDFERRFMRE